MKPRGLNHNFGGWKEVKMCNYCGTLAGDYVCNEFTCRGCGKTVNINNWSSIILKWIGIPYTPFGYYKLR